MEMAICEKNNEISNGDKNGAVAAYDPFKERKYHTTPTTDNETLIHLMKASLGTGMLSMPMAFKYSGFAVGFFTTSIAALTSAYCSYTLVQSAHALYHKTRISVMSYPMVVEAAFNSRPTWGKRMAKPLRLTTEVSLLVSYFGTISLYNVIIASTYQKVIEHHTNYPIDVRFYILCLLPFLILLGYIPNLKALSPFSMVANILTVIGIGVIISHLIFDLKNPLSLPQVPEDVTLIPNTLSITVFAMEAIGLILHLENNMKNPSRFLGTWGIHNRGVAVVSLSYISFGMIGYLRFGNEVKGSITHNLDNRLIGLQIANVAIATAVLFTYVLLYLVCLEIVWNVVKPYCSRKPIFYNYLVRTIIVTSSVLLAVAVPSIAPFVNLIGAFCFTFLGIITPIAISIVTFWDDYSLFKMFIKSVPVIILGLVILSFGTFNSMLDIINLYSIAKK